MEKKIYTVAVDLGSSNVVVIVGSKNDDGSLRIEKVVSKPAEGVNAGEVENIALVGNSIRMAMQEVESALGIRVSEVYTGISGRFMRCASYTDHVFTIDSQSGVSQRDVDALFERMANVQAPDDEIIMERIPQNYMVDDGHEVKNPVGSFGKRLSSTFNFILCKRTPLDRLQRAFNGLNINLLGIYPSMLSSVEAVALPEEMEEGVAIVNLGGHKTDVTVVCKNVVRYVASIPMGGEAINHDICTLSIPEKYVEALKQSYGSAVAAMSDRKTIKIKGRTQREMKCIQEYNLATAIEARTMDIIDMVKDEIKESGFAGKLTYGIILTGAGARMRNIDELFRRETGMEVRISEHDVNIASEKPAKSYFPACSTALGLLILGIKDGKSTLVARSVPQPPVTVPTPAATSQPASPQRPETKPEPVSEPQPASEQPKPKPEPRPDESGKGWHGTIRGWGADDDDDDDTKLDGTSDDDEWNDDKPRRRFGIGSLIKKIGAKATGFINETLDGGADEEV